MTLTSRASHDGLFDHTLSDGHCRRLGRYWNLFAQFCGWVSFKSTFDIVSCSQTTISGIDDSRSTSIVLLTFKFGCLRYHFSFVGIIARPPILSGLRSLPESRELRDRISAFTENVKKTIHHLCFGGQRGQEEEPQRWAPKEPLLKDLELHIHDLHASLHDDQRAFVLTSPARATPWVYHKFDEDKGCTTTVRNRGYVRPVLEMISMPSYPGLLALRDCTEAANPFNHCSKCQYQLSI